MVLRITTAALTMFFVSCLLTCWIHNYRCTVLFPLLLDSKTGSSQDWAYRELGLDLSFSYELRGRTNDDFYYGFLAPHPEIKPTSEEVLQSLIGLTTRARELGYL